MRITKRNFQVRPTISASVLAGIAEVAACHAGRTADSASFVFIDDARMIEHHSLYKGVKRPTDVLAFPAGDPDPSGELDLGDVVICTDQAARQAAGLRGGYLDELRVLALHGFLHLLGYDHERDSGQMRRLEMELRPKVMRLVHEGH
jgi:probable rRNA maturation factor